ncbi:MAG: DUF742 domain-containing protein [Acidimicrobiia bacterium]
MSLPAPPAPAVGGRIVRPYTLTGGRTGAEGPVIALEALVAATIEGLRAKWRYRWESVEIIELSRRETAIIELAALLEVPIGVVRVLVADLRERGAVTVTDPPLDSPDRDKAEYTELLNKVLDGIKSL